MRANVLTLVRLTGARASSYAAVFDATAGAIERRVANYRRLAIAVIAVVLLAPAAAAVLHSWRPLAALVLVIPCCAVGVARDVALVAAWRRGVLAAQAAGEIDLDIFRVTIVANRALPRGTLEGMLATLPATTTLTGRGQ